MGEPVEVWSEAVERIAASVPAECAAAFRALLVGTGRPLWRGQMRPGHVTASAFVISPDGGSMLLIDHVALGLWLQPGGHIEGDAGPVEAAAREAKEESGVELIGGEVFDLDIHEIPARPKRGEDAHRHYDFRVAFRAASWKLVAADAGVRAARWVPWESLATVDTDDSVRRSARRLLAMPSSAGLPHPRG